MLNLFKKNDWVVVDCLTGLSTKIVTYPFEIGAGEGVDLKLNGQGVAERHCAVNQVKGHGLCLIKQEGSQILVVDGQAVDYCKLVPDQDYAVKVGGHFLVIRGGRDLNGWLRGLDFNQWILQDSATNQVDGPMGFDELCQFAKDHQRNHQTLLIPQGMTNGFLLYDAFEVRSARLAAAQTDGQSDEETLLLTDPGSQGQMTCIVCWLNFDIGDIMHITSHDSLRGDPVLGEDAQQRFLATRFNDRGQALDAMGLPCTEIACPHCRRRLPAGYTSAKNHIISIVGDQGAGKSYYLSVLLNELPTRLFNDFSVVFQDADPTGNAIINQMKQVLFGARTPEEARLVKTQLEGGMYERLPRQGRMVALPRPFVFSVASPTAPEKNCSLIFYDNAGEHFQPGRDSLDSPGAQHVASSSGILFLFDPFNNPEFRRLLADGSDPQLDKPVIDQQSIILSEMKVRITRLLNLELAQQIDAPLAVLVGKSDAWIHLLGKKALKNPVAGGKLDMAAVRHNSHQVRELMKKICTPLVANAESISRNVVFFPVSSFGHTPVKIGPGEYAPNPLQLKPFMVETPMLWVLSNVAPELVPVELETPVPTQP